MSEEIELRKLFLDRRLTIKEVAKKMNWTPSKTANRLHKHGIRKHDLGQIEIEEKKIIYIAGLFDGEGSFYITIQYYEERGMKLKPVINIGMTDENTISTVFNWLKEAGFHPKFRKTKYKGRDKRGYDRTKWKPFYRVRLFWNQEIKYLLKALLPWLITKKSVAELGIEYLEQREWGNPYTDSDFEIALKIKHLNGGD